jgi:hypothetical protein
VTLPLPVNNDHDTKPLSGLRMLEVRRVAEYARLLGSARGDEMRVYVLSERDRDCEHALNRSKVLAACHIGRPGLGQPQRFVMLATEGPCTPTWQSEAFAREKVDRRWQKAGESGEMEICWVTGRASAALNDALWA